MHEEVAPDLLSAIMERVGFAVWQVQELENTAAHFLVIRVRGTRGMGRSKGHELLARAQQHTFGVLINELAAAGVLERELAEQLAKTVDERNWLVHRARRESRGLLVKESVYKQLWARTEQLASDALGLTKRLAEETEKYVVSQGVSEEQLERESAILAKAWGLR